MRWRASVLASLLAAGAAFGETLDIYFVDVEGGQATLLVSPAGESLLVDAGWPGFDGRDAGRIAAAAGKAGVRRIDYMLVTHYHVDHVGGVPAVAERLPIATYVDHGPSTETGRARSDELAQAYYRVRDRGEHLVVRPGDKIPLKGIDVWVVSARGAVLDAPLAGAGGGNRLCESSPRKDDDPTENARSVGILVTYGKFRFVNLGDLTWNKELELACPADKLGQVDVYLTSHHGLAQSGPPALVHALNPRVAIMNNGAKKGGAAEAWRVVKSVPRLEGFWQLHYAIAAGKQANVEERYIANIDPESCGYGLQLSARPDGSFTVTNERNGYSESYGPAGR